jgi:hypothetical protein
LNIIKYFTNINKNKLKKKEIIMPINIEQWIKIQLQLIGLRSGTNPNDIDGASYAMDMGPHQFNKEIPNNWNQLLKSTIELIKGFEGSDDRFLLIVLGVTGTSWDYPGCFPKCSTHPRQVLASTSLIRPIEELVEWVLENI